MNNPIECSALPLVQDFNFNRSSKALSNPNFHLNASHDRSNGSHNCFSKSNFRLNKSNFCLNGSHDRFSKTNFGLNGSHDRFKVSNRTLSHILHLPQSADFSRVVHGSNPPRTGSPGRNRTKSTQGDWERA